MKKILSIVLSVVMAASVCTMAVIPAMAKIVASPESTTKATSISVSVNGGASTDVTYRIDSTDPSIITFTYDGDGNLIGWEFKGLVEGVDYVIIDEDATSITIKLLNTDADVIANAIVEEKNDEPTKEQTTETTTVKDKDNGNTSPATGVAMSGVLVAGAGVAMLTVLKRKNK